MEQPSSSKEEILSRQFESVCKMALDGEAVDYHRQLKRRMQHEISLELLPIEQMEQFIVEDKHEAEAHYFEVMNITVEVHNKWIADCIRRLPEKKQTVILLAFFENMRETEIAELMQLANSTVSLRIDSKKKDVRKVYQENGNLFRFAEYFKDDDILLADTPDTALIQALRHLSPVTVVDESHNAGSDLSVEMLNNLNPSLVLDLTATPRKNSNIISYVDARELKKENMVKLPVVVYNRTTTRGNAIKAGIRVIVPNSADTMVAIKTF